MKNKGRLLDAAMGFALTLFVAGSYCYRHPLLLGPLLESVEFKTYAAHELPHARVIAVESEREFGLSVLQRLDADLKRRAELFRAAGAQDLA